MRHYQWLAIQSVQNASLHWIAAGNKFGIGPFDAVQAVPLARPSNFSGLSTYHGTGLK